ncbi:MULTISPECIES: hypothetical protein [Pseudomonadota]|uniref:Uncharacterized protein n=3 Tax=Sphingomonadaceae TaxID=41297 RepID=A0A1L6J865_9SPHN|nr:MULTISPECIES: hypothetical protein [Pseudomonadota]OJY69984.1 MAG: hypothetical protein BGP16_09765 [Sphingobium sp. 66-54]APR52089.1 hypothetical protein BRX40_06260 [Sphingomonas koreensis]MBX9663543.1 hypothetical protein [Novosphingobium sp.]MBZ6382685.1 hypothetical protein [Sphingomonas sanguinis]MDG5971126.1 hypothetical protein [Sphingomonas paucimobilis]
MLDHNADAHPGTGIAFAYEVANLAFGMGPIFRRAVQAVIAGSTSLAFGRRQHDRDDAKRFKIVALGIRQADHHREPPIALEQGDRGFQGNLALLVD